MSASSVSRRLRVVCYFRMSSDKQGESIEQQEEWAAGVCERETLDVAATFTDRAVAGHDTQGRSDFHAMIEYVKRAREAKRPVDAVVCWSAARFSRSDSQETAFYLWQLRQAGCHLMLTQDGWIDFADDNQRILFNLKQDTSEHAYVKRLSAETLRGKKRTADLGYWCGGPAPFGYRLVHEMVETGDGKKQRRARLAVDEDTAERARWLFTEYASGDASLYDLARQLTAAGVTPRRARAWSATVVRKILRNAVYLGDLLWNKSTQGKFGRILSFCFEAKHGVPTKEENDPSEYIIAAQRHPALVDRATFDKVQRRLLERQGMKKSSAARKCYLLAGLMYCGNCNGRMISRSQPTCRGPVKHYICGTYNTQGAAGCGSNIISEAALVRAIVKKVRQELLNPETLDRLEQALVRLGSGVEKETAARTAELRRQLATVAELAAAAAERYLTERDPAIAAACKRTLKDLLDRKEAAERAVAESVAAITPRVDAEKIVARAREYMADLNDAIQRGDQGKLRVLLRELIERIELTFDHRRDDGGRVRCRFVRGLIYLSGAAVPTDYQTLTEPRRSCRRPPR